MQDALPMTPTLSRTLCLAAVLLAPLAAQDQKVFEKLQHEDTYGSEARAFAPRFEREFAWAPDGQHLVLRGQARPRFDARTGAEVEAVATTKSEPSAREAFALALQAARPEGGRVERLLAPPEPSTLPRTPTTRSGLLVSPDGATAIAAFDGALFVWRKDSGLRQVQGDFTGLRELQLAPDGRRASGIFGFDLHVIDLETGARTPISTDGSENLFYGELDWVYQEEIYGRFNFRGAFWAPNGSGLAYLRTDESGVDTFTVIDHLPTTLRREELKYPKAGTTNPRATLHVADAADGAHRAFDLSAWPAEDEILIVRVGWTPESDAVIFQIQNREQTWLDLVSGDPKTGAVRRLFRETSKSWVNVLLDEPRWLEDGTFLWESERTGYRHVYHYRRDGSLIRAVTAGEWQVKEVTHVDAAKGQLEFIGTEGGAINVLHYRIGLDGTGLTRLTPGPGTHQIAWNNDRSLFINTFSAFDEPGEQRLVDADGKVVRVLSEAPMPRGALKYGMSLPTLHEVKARDGYPLDATVLKPIPFDPSQNYPVWLETYSGPDAPSVFNRWPSSAWHQFLAQQGIIVLQVNVRSASGRGQKHTETCYQRFGVQELEDLEDTVRWLTAEPWADESRVGITGWSYGGTITAFALTNSKLFKVGIAGAGVYDWRNYDTVYTERYMRKPVNNPEGYERSSVLTHAKNLHGHLLIVHGTIDDNVHFQNAVQLVYALQRAGKSFEFMMYPATRHGVREPALLRHYRELIWSTIQKHL